MIKLQKTSEEYFRMLKSEIFSTARIKPSGEPPECPGFYYNNKRTRFKVEYCDGTSSTRLESSFFGWTGIFFYFNKKPYIFHYVGLPIEFWLGVIWFGLFCIFSKSKTNSLIGLAFFLIIMAFLLIVTQKSRKIIKKYVKETLDAVNDELGQGDTPVS